MGETPPRRHPLEQLDPSEQEFVLRFVLLSGSLKELARAYGVSYPTLRARLDRLIARLRQLCDGRPADPFAEVLGDLVERGEITPSAARRLLELHRRQLDAHKGG